MSFFKKNLVLLGPTASGKTSFAVRLARMLDVEIIGVDSRQVYRGLDIGSGKDRGEYLLPGGGELPVHLLDVADPVRADFSLADFLSLAARAEKEIRSRGRVPFYVGGTALYLHALLSRYNLRGGAPDPAGREQLRTLSAEQLCAELLRLNPDDPAPREEPSNRTRLIRKIEILRGLPAPATEKELPPDPDQDYLILGVLRDRTEIRANIEKRLDERLAAGMLDEARRLHDAGVAWETMEFFGLEYRYMALHLQGKITEREMRDTLLCKIRQFAKRQDSWFRKMERDGFPIYWFRPGETEKAADLCRSYLSGESLPPPEIRLENIVYGPRQNRPDHEKNGKFFRDEIEKAD